MEVVRLKGEDDFEHGYLPSIPATVPCSEVQIQDALSKIKRSCFPQFRAGEVVPGMEGSVHRR